jgi:primosomal protein N' (replication factor Y)
MVTVRHRREIGVIVDTEAGSAMLDTAAAEAPERRYKVLAGIPDPVPALPPPLLRTCRWLADYYAAPLGIALRSALPALLAEPDAPLPPPRSRRVAVISRSIDSLLERDQLFKRARKQRIAFELLESLGRRAPVEHLQRQLGISSAVLKGLERRGLISFDRQTVYREGLRASTGSAPSAATTSPLRPTPAQRAAIDRITSCAAGGVFLLHGVTASGKTLVYIEVLRRIVMEQGRTAIVLVPEIALTPQTVDRFRAAFGDQVAVLHSALSDGERLDAWRAIRDGHRRIVVGARSAIFAPLENVGAIIVDEEHESSYKQNETPRYHARDVAIVRAREEGRAVVVLGSATPCLESWANAARGAYHLLSLPERVGGGTLPRIEVVDRRNRAAAPGAGSAGPFRRVFSDTLEQGIGACLTRGEQAILLLNRRGYAAFVQCIACGEVAVCPNCSISLTLHRAPERLVCHYCAHAEPPRTTCLRCGQGTVQERGLGTQQVERLLAERFPSARIARMDVDTTSGKWAHADILDRVGRGEVDVLLGTQMIAKGLDFPNVTLVGVVDADVGMNLPDFRAAERCYQLMAQVAGRAGRGPKGGTVYIQTRLPEHHAVRCAFAHDYLGFVRHELVDRASPPYPPAVRLANVVFSGPTEAPTAALAQNGADWLTRKLRRARAPEVTVIGPAPCPVERVKARWRWHLLLKAERNADLSRVIRYFAAKFAIERRGGFRVIVDRDPVTLL